MSHLFQDDGPPRGESQQKVCIATTAYDSPDASYTFAIQKTREAMHSAGIPTAYYLLSGNCHVDDARNSVVQEFLLSDCTDLVFIDADVSWEPDDLITLCRYDCEIVGGVYPFRRESRILKMPVRMLENVVDPDEDGLLEVEGLPAGFMRIQRHVLESLSRDTNRYWSRGDRRAQIPILFERTFEREIRWGGDLHFCNLWRQAGGKVHAAYEMTLGHTAKIIVRDSMGSVMRRLSDETLGYVAKRIRARTEDEDVYREARKYADNAYGALDDVLILCTVMARQANGPIIEAGSGLTSIVLAAAAPEQTVYVLEHDEIWAAQLDRMARQAGLDNFGLCLAPLRDGWYDLEPFEPDLPKRFALGLNDGPPRKFSSRMGFYENLGHRVDTIIVDDADDRVYGDAVEEWCAENRRRVDFLEGRAALIRGEAAAANAA